jgi:predicted alpha/beta-hydrolase family hydrolase
MARTQDLSWTNVPFLFIFGERASVDSDENHQDGRIYDRSQNIWLISQDHDLVPLVLCNSSAPGTKTVTRSSTDEELDD